MSVCLSVRLFVRLPNGPSICPFVLLGPSTCRSLSFPCLPVRTSLSVCLSALLCPTTCPSFFVRLFVRLSLCPSTYLLFFVRLPVRPSFSICLSALLCPSDCPPFSLSDCLFVFSLNYPLAHEHKFCSIEHFFSSQKASNVSEVRTFRFSRRFSRQMSIVVEFFLGLTGHRGRRRKTVRRWTYERAVCRLWHPS